MTRPSGVFDRGTPRFPLVLSVECGRHGVEVDVPCWWLPGDYRACCGERVNVALGRQ